MESPVLYLRREMRVRFGRRRTLSRRRRPGADLSHPRRRSRAAAHVAEVGVASARRRRRPARRRRTMDHQRRHCRRASARARDRRHRAAARRRHRHALHAGRRRLWRSAHARSRRGAPRRARWASCRSPPRRREYGVRLDPAILSKSSNSCADAHRIQSLPGESNDHAAQAVRNLSCCGARGRRERSAPPTIRRQPIHIVVPWTAGGFTDVFGRIMAEKLTKSARPAGDRRQQAGRERRHRQRVREPRRARRLHAAAHDQRRAGVERRHGRGARRTIRAANPKPTYDPMSDFTQVSLMGTQPVLLAVGSHVPAQDARRVRRDGQGEAGRRHRTARRAKAARSTWRWRCSARRPASR